MIVPLRMPTVNKKMAKQKLLFGEGTVEDFKKGQRMFTMLAEALFRPVVVPQMWSQDVTDHEKMMIKMARMKQVAQSNGKPLDRSTDYEALVALRIGSLEAPLNRVYLRIYYHLFNRFYPEKAKEIGIPNEALGPHGKQELGNLKRKLYRKGLQAMNNEKG